MASFNSHKLNVMIEKCVIFKYIHIYSPEWDFELFYWFPYCIRQHHRIRNVLLPYFLLLCTTLVPMHPCGVTCMIGITRVRLVNSEVICFCYWSFRLRINLTWNCLFLSWWRRKQKVEFDNIFSIIDLVDIFDVDGINI